MVLKSDQTGDYSDKLRNLRLATRSKQYEIANSLSMSREAYCMFENGQRQPANQTLISLAKYYQVSLDYIFGLTDCKASFAFISDDERHLVEAVLASSGEIKRCIAELVKLPGHPEP